jgi:hypothetical protein
VCSTFILASNHSSGRSSDSLCIATPIVDKVVIQSLVPTGLKVSRYAAEILWP